VFKDNLFNEKVDNDEEAAELKELKATLDKVVFISKLEVDWNPLNILNYILK